jgi:type I restriction enzyme S subunit
VRTRIREGDVLITIVGSVGQVAIVPAELHGWNIARAVAMIRPKKPELSRWISLVLRSPSAQHQLGVSANTTVQTTINLKDLRQLQVPFPRAAERRAIAHILGTLDDKIEINRKQNETLEATVRALFKAWFVDFEPVRAKMKGCLQRGRSLSGFPAHLYDLFPDRFVESDIGLIPEGWRLGSLGEISINPRRGVRPDEIEEETPYIALENMPKRCIALSEWGVANSLESNKYKFRRGEILFGKLRPYFHKVGVAPVDGVCSTDMVVVAPKLPMWFGFVLAHVSSDAFVEYTSAGSTGTKMPRTTWTEMARYAVALPHEDVAASFNLHVDAASEKIIANIHDSITVAQLRDTLLPKLISGELRVPDAERIIGAAV